MINRMKIMNVRIADINYDVCIARDLKNDIVSFLLDKTKNYNVLIVTDEYFENHYATSLVTLLEDAGFNVLLHVMAGGKVSKSFNEVLKIYGVMEVEDFARDSTLIALGGGVIGDLAGFVASTWYRGMNLIHIPTSLMSMVDSSIGGKVAINFRDTINAVGNYYHPIANFMDVDLIDSLPDRDYISGLAEVIKCALIADKDFFDYLNAEYQAILSRDEDKLVYCIKKTIQIKVDHVSHDVKENGKRLLLNYGHTLGHAIEMATQTNKGETFRHGEGVALGISAVLFLSECQLQFSTDKSEQVRELLSSFQLPTEFSAADYGYDRVDLVNDCMKLILKDKKRKDNQLRFILLESIGKANTYTALNPEHIRQAFMTVIKE